MRGTPFWSASVSRARPPAFCAGPAVVAHRICMALRRCLLLTTVCPAAYASWALAALGVMPETVIPRAQRRLPAILAGINDLGLVAREYKGNKPLSQPSSAALLHTKQQARKHDLPAYRDGLSLRRLRGTAANSSAISPGGLRAVLRRASLRPRKPQQDEHQNSSSLFDALCTES